MKYIMSRQLTISNRQYTREEAMSLLGIKGRQTLTSYCNALQIEPYTRAFSEGQFTRLNNLRIWRKNKGRICDFVKNEALSQIA
jgi:hypothetical protein